MLVLDESIRITTIEPPCQTEQSGDSPSNQEDFAKIRLDEMLYRIRNTAVRILMIPVDPARS